MTIINYQEFTETFNELFTDTSIRDVQSFDSSSLQSKEIRKKRISQISQEINKLKLDIEQYQYKIKHSLLKKDKKEYGIVLNSLLSSKKDLIQQYNQQRQANAFTELSLQARIYACAMALLNKYMTDEICRHNPLGFNADASGNVFVPIDFFKNSYLYQSAAHIKDFVSSYIENYPERVRGARYFVGLYKDITSLTELTDKIDLYFENMSKPEQKEYQRIKKSHMGMVPIAFFANDGVQAVKLISKEALDYEGSSLKHCVGTYAGKVEKGETEIYSIRDIGAENRELIPHATIEFKNGAIQQIKGYRDSLVDFNYIHPTRLLAMHLLHTDDFDDVIHDKNLRLQDKNNIGIYEDCNKCLHDIYNLCQTDAVFDHIVIGGSSLSYFPLHKMTISNMVIKGIFPQCNTQILDDSSAFKYLSLSDCVFDGNILDLKKASTNKLQLDFKQAKNVKKIILPEDVCEVSILGDLPNLTYIEFPQNLHYLKIKGSMPKIKCLDFSSISLYKLSIQLNGRSELSEIILPPKLQEFGLSGDITNLTDINFPRGLKSLVFGIATDEYSQKQLMQQIEKIDTISHLQLDWKCMPLETLIVPKNITYLNISCDSFPNLKQLDLSENHQLKTLEFSNPSMPVLSVLKLPDNLENLVCCSFSAPNLKELDLSKLPVKHFGRIKPQTIGSIVFDHDTNYLLDNSLENRSLIPQSLHLGGFTFQCANFSGLEKLYLPLAAETITLGGMHFENLGHVDFSGYDHLQKVSLTSCNLGDKCFLDFSQCPTLQFLDCRDDMIDKIKVSPQIEKIVVNDKDYHAQVHNYQTFTKKQKALQHGFFPKPIYHGII